MKSTKTRNLVIGNTVEILSGYYGHCRNTGELIGIEKGKYNITDYRVRLHGAFNPGMNEFVYARSQLKSVPNPKSIPNQKEDRDMTLKQFQKMAKKLLKTVSDDLLRDSERMFNSGGIDPATYENTALLPKIILAATIANYKIALPDGVKKDVKNLQCF